MYQTNAEIIFVIIYNNKLKIMITDNTLLQILSNVGDKIGFIQMNSQFGKEYVENKYNWRRKLTYTKPVKDGFPSRYFQVCIEIVNRPGITMKELVEIVSKKYDPYYEYEWEVNTKAALRFAMEPMRWEEKYFLSKNYRYYPSLWMLNFVKEHIDEVDISLIPENL